MAGRLSDAAATPRDAATEVVLLRRWQNLDHVPPLHRLCRDACRDGVAAVLVRVPGAAGLRRVLLVDVGAMGAGASLDRGEGLPDTVAACLAAWVASGGGTVCGRPIERAWRLPYGL